MFECNCGKSYKTEKGYIDHISKCEYVDLDIKKVLRLGRLINNSNKFLFHVALGKIRKFAKENGIPQEDAKKILTKEAILKYKKSLWDILQVWKVELIISEYRVYTEWVFKTYKDITLLSLRNTLSNPKIIYRYNLEHTAEMISNRIEDSLLFLHNKNEFSNDFEFIDHIMSGEISMYYIIFNDWLAEEWFGRLDIDLQKELEELVEIVTKTVLDRINHKEFEELQELASSQTPKIYEMV